MGVSLGYCVHLIRGVVVGVSLGKCGCGSMSLGGVMKVSVSWMVSVGVVVVHLWVEL